MGTFPITIEVPPELATRLQQRSADLPHILELGLRAAEWQANLEFSGAADVLDFLAALPTPDEVIALRPSPELQSRIEVLLDKNRTEGLTLPEQEEWNGIEHLEHLVRVAKAHAYLKLNE